MAGFDRVRVASNQRGESQDLNATNELALANIARAMRGFYAPIASRVYRGLLVKATSPASASVDVHPGAAMDASYNMLVLDATTSLVIAENANANPRIDIVQIKYTDAEAQSESRQRWNPATEAWYAANVNVRKSAGISVAVKAGTPGANPTPQAPDSGYFVIAQIAVPGSWTGGGRTIASTDITNLQSARGTGLVAEPWLRAGEPSQWAFSGGDYVSGTILSLETPEGMASMIELLVTWQLSGGTAPVQPLSFFLEDAGSGAGVAALSQCVLGAWATGLEKRYVSTRLVGTVAGPTTGARNYRLRIKRRDDGQGGVLPSVIQFVGSGDFNTVEPNRVTAFTF